MPTLTPKLLTTPPAQTGAKATSNNSKPDDAPQQAFGTVLARQLDAEQPAADVAASLKGGKKLAIDTLAQDATPSTDVTQPAQDPAANLIALLQAPVELRSMTSAAALPAEGPSASIAEVTSRPDEGKALPLTLADKLLAPQQRAESGTSAKTVALATADKSSNAAPLALSAAALDPAKVTEAKPLILADTLAVAPRAQDVAAFSAPALSAVPSTVQSAPSAPVTVATPMGSSVWADDFAQQVTWMANGKLEQSASLHLNPPDLGPMQVVVKVTDSQATVMFSSPHGAVREAIENALPKLRELMADNGITLGNTSVSDQAPRERNEANDNGTSRRSAWSSGEAIDGGVRSSSVASTITRHKGMVDTFA